jgi:hypothetical protein
VAPGRNGNPSAFPSGFAPRRYQRRTPRWEQAPRTLTRGLSHHPALPRQHRHGYAAGLHHGLLTEGASRLRSRRRAPAPRLSLRSTYQAMSSWTSSGLPRSAGVRHDRGGPLLYPGAAVSSRSAGHNQSAPAASQRPALHPRCHHPSAREALTRHQRRFTQLTRPIFPLPVAPGRNGNPSAFPSGFAPRRYQRRTPRWEQAPRTLTRGYTFDISRTSNS